MNILSDDMLEKVNGGTSRYTDKELKDAGVKVEKIGGKVVYSYKLSDGTVVPINDSVADNVVDCFLISGGAGL